MKSKITFNNKFRIRKYYSILLLVVIIFSCNKDESIQESEGFYLRTKIDTTENFDAKESTVRAIYDSNNDNTLTIQGITIDNKKIALEINLFKYGRGVDTYNENGVYFSFSLLDLASGNITDNWSANIPGSGGGTLIVTEETETTIKGTFHFESFTQFGDLNQYNSSLSITNGEFYAKKEGTPMQNNYYMITTIDANEPFTAIENTVKVSYYQDNGDFMTIVGETNQNREIVMVVNLQNYIQGSGTYTQDQVNFNFYPSDNIGNIGQWIAGPGSTLSNGSLTILEEDDTHIKGLFFGSLELLNPFSGYNSSVLITDGIFNAKKE